MEHNKSIFIAELNKNCRKLNISITIVYVFMLCISPSDRFLEGVRDQALPRIYNSRIVII